MAKVNLTEEDWKKKLTPAEKNLLTQSYRSVRLPAVRGRILDRQGVILAESRPSYNVNLYLEELRPAFQEQYQLLKSNTFFRTEQENKTRKQEASQRRPRRR